MKANISNPNAIHNNFGLEFSELTLDEYQSLKGFWYYLDRIQTTFCEEKKEFDKKFGHVNAFLQGDSVPFVNKGCIYIEFWSDDIEQIIAYCEMWQEKFKNNEECNFVIEGL